MSVPRVDPSARVANSARLADDVEIGPYCVIGPHVELRAGVRLISHVSVTGVTVIGERLALVQFVGVGLVCVGIIADRLIRANR